MTNEQIEELKRHFMEWSGGFEPESGYQITVYVDYARDARLGADSVREVLEEWMTDELSSEVSRDFDKH
jgi:hypothetical protein